MKDRDMLAWLEQIERQAEALISTIEGNGKVSKERRDSAVLLIDTALKMVRHA